MLASFTPQGALQRGLIYAAVVVVGVILLVTREAQRRGWIRLTTRLLPRYPWGHDRHGKWYETVRWTFMGLFLLAIGLAGFGSLIFTGR
jgi:hypothetical protein